MESIEASQGFAEEIDANELSFLEVVGKGAFGVVSRARWKDKDVAVKLIETESEKKAFITELKQLSRVNHPNIVKLYGACTKQPVCLVMEYAEGGSLYNVLHGQGPQPQYTSAHAMSWALQCARGVEYLHGMKPKALIHRDLKPPNLLLVMGGTVLKICDFGTACDIQTHMTNNKGSAAWMAPEVFEGCKYTEKCDVFSWAIILWEVLTRRKPFDEIGGPAFRIMWAVHNGTRPPMIKNLPKPLQTLMTTCWAFNAVERPSMAEVARIMTYMFQFFKGADETLVYPPSAEEDMGEYTYDPPIMPSVLMTGTYGSHFTPSTAGGESRTGTIRETIRQALDRGEPVPVVSPPALHRATPPVVVEEEQGGKSQKSAPASLAASRESLLDNSRSPRSGTPVDPFKRYSADLSRLDEIDIMSQGMNAPQPAPVQGHRRSGSYGTAGIVTHGFTRPVSGPTVRGHRRIGSDEYTQALSHHDSAGGRSTPTGHSGSPSPGRSTGPTLPSGIHHVNTYPGTLKQHSLADGSAGAASSSLSSSQPPVISHSISYTPGLSIQVPTEEPTAVPASGADYAMNMVYLSLDHQLQPLTPYPTSTESMAIFEQHCQLAQYYLRVQTEIALLMQRKHELIKEFEQEEQMSEQNTSHLAEEYTRLCTENESLELLHKNLSKQVEQIRRNQQQNRRVIGN